MPQIAKFAKFSFCNKLFLKISISGIKLKSWNLFTKIENFPHGKWGKYDWLNLENSSQIANCKLMFWLVYAKISIYPQDSFYSFLESTHYNIYFILRYHLKRMIVSESYRTKILIVGSVLENQCCQNMKTCHQRKNFNIHLEA